MLRQCEHCGTSIAGRSDKRFCSVKCKNAANMARRRATLSVVRQTDRYLHRNREILDTLMGLPCEIQALLFHRAPHATK